MHHLPMDFHNTVDLPEAPGGGLQLARFPSSIWDQAEAAMGNKTIRSSNGCELRFVTTANRIRIYLRNLTGEEKPLIHLCGNHIIKEETLRTGGIQCLDVDIPERRQDIDPHTWRKGGFSPDVYRIVSVGATLAYHGMDAMGGDIRPPGPEELPAKRWLAYGSSITQAGGTFTNYVNVAAQLLEVDAYNLGMGGSCWIEPAIADFIAARDDWEFASFELGVNMRRLRDNTGFRKKVDYLLETVTEAHPDNPLFLITHFRNAEHHETGISDQARDQMEKDDILREAATRFPDQVTLVEGTDIAPDLRGFKRDLLHPEPFAYVRMGINLAEAMRQVPGTG
jgi:hypothetical protein